MLYFNTTVPCASSLQLSVITLPKQVIHVNGHRGTVLFSQRSNLKTDARRGLFHRHHVIDQAMSTRAQRWLLGVFYPRNAYP
jgi:hypothetical protein